MDPIYDWISYALKAKFEDLPIGTVDVIKNTVVDTLGVALAGSGSEGIGALLSLVKDWGGKHEASVIAYGGKVPAPVAALVNGSMARACDFDEVHENGGGHLSATTVPAAFALAEYCNKPVNGRDFILISALCSEINCRIRIASGSPTGWLHETFAPIGVAVMGSKLLGFDESKMQNAIGIAFAQCSGNGQAMLDGAMTTRLQQGLGASAGVLSMLLAERGFTGAKNVFLGKYGLFHLYANGQYDPKVFLGDIGKHFEFINSSIKPYPCCKMTHTAIFSVIEITREYNIKPNDISKIVITTNSFAFNLCALGDHKYNIKTTQDAQFSLPYTVSVAILNQKVTFADFTTEAIKNNDVLMLAKKIKVILDPNKDKQNAFVCPADVEIFTIDGRQYSKTTEFIKGHPKNRFNFDECVEKFMECSHRAVRPLSNDNLNKAIKLVERLEQLDDVTEIIKLLS